MKLWKKLTAAALMSAAMLGAGLTAKPLLPVLTGAEITAQAAETVTVYGLTFTKYDTYAVVTGCTDPSATALIIPAAVDGVPVTEIGEDAFRDCTDLTVVTIPDNVTRIGNYAFYGCTDLASVTIPDSVTRIDNYAFYGCTSLTCIVIPDGVTRIDYYVFYGCTGLKSVTIPDSVRTIDGYAFADCTSLTSITIPDRVRSIYEFAFDGCTSLTNITIPDGVTSIGAGAFRCCTGLTSITIPDSVKSIDLGAFFYCTSLSSITIPGSVTEIGYYVFFGCTSLTSITILDGVTKIGEEAFYGCSSLTDIQIPDSVTSIGDSVFTDTPWLITKRSENPLVIVNQILIDGQTADGDIVIPEGITSLCDHVFDGCTGLTSIIIPDSVTSIGRFAFKNCSGLTSINIPEGLTSIRFSAFSGCTGLTSFKIPQSVTSIGAVSFENCTGLKSITIPDSVTNISNQAFYGCNSLKTVTIPNSVTTFGHSVFEGCTDLTIYGCSGSRAEWYANINSVPFKEIPEITSVTLSKNSFPYTGKQVKVGNYITVKSGSTKLKYGTDFTMTYANNINAGTASVTVTGIGRYSGSTRKTYLITPLEIDSVTLSKTAFPYTGKQVKVGSYISSVMSGSTKLKYGTDFTLSYSNNVKCGIGTASVTVIGIGNYSGTVTKYYSILPARQAKPKLSTLNGKFHVEWAADANAEGYQVQYCKDASFTGDTLHNASFTGKTFCNLAAYPKNGETWYVRVRSYMKNKAGTNHGYWSVAACITIGKIDNVTLSQTEFACTGKAVKVGSYIKVKSGTTALKYGTDFELVYKNNVNKGTASVTVKGIGEYAGSSITKTYKIK